MNKSPISLLQEILIKEGYVPTYTYTYTGNKGYTCTATCKNLNINGTGNNKKEAKQNAAQNMLLSLSEKDEIFKASVLNKIQHTTINKMQNPVLAEVYETPNKNISDNVPAPLSKQTIPEFNYVGLMQELCTKFNLILPVYNLINEDGPSHMKIFTMEGIIGSFKMIGRAHCKKSAKQAAAKNLLQLLIFEKKIPAEGITANEYCNELFDFNNLQLSNIETSDVQRRESISPIKDVSEKALLSYVKPICNTTTMQNITIQNNHLTVKNTHTNALPAKPIITEECYEQTSENASQKFDLDESIIKINEPTVSISLAKPLNKIQSVNIESNSIEIGNKSSAVKNDQNNIFLTAFRNGNDFKRMLEDDIRKFNVEITNVSETPLPILEVSKNKNSVHTAPNSIETGKTSSAVKNDQNNELLTALQNSNDFKRILQDNMQKFNTEISNDREIPLSILEMLQNKDSDDIASNTDIRAQDCRNECINNSHFLFKKMYGSLISDDLRKKMQSINAEDIYKSLIIQDTCQDIQRVLRVNLKLISSNKCGSDHIVYLRMSSKPIITQVGIGKTTNEAETRAMYEIINTILDFLK